MTRFNARFAPVVDAVQWDGNADTANAFLGESYGVDWEHVRESTKSILIPTANAVTVVRVGDWIVKDGQKFACLGCDEFTQLYAPADPSVASRGET